MSKNYLPLKPIPLPNYDVYRADMYAKHQVTLPLKPVPSSAQGLLSILPMPLATNKDGWPWTAESKVAYQAVTGSAKISVVVPSYNQGLYIEETIRSVILQNYPNLELIIIDGGSNDETLQVLNHYRDFVSLAISEPDNGQSHAINKGFAVASGQLYMWLNSDDYLLRDAFNRIVPSFLQDTNLDITYGHGLVVNDRQQITFEYAPLVKNRYLRFGGILLSHTVMWRSKVHHPIWEDLQCAMDAEFWLRLFPGRRAKHLHFPVSVFRKHDQQKTSSAAMGQKWKQDFEQYIWPHYPAISAGSWKRRQFEYRMVQKFYKLLHQYRHKH